MDKKVLIEDYTTIEDFVNIVRHNHKIVLGDKYKDRVRKNREILEKFVAENRIIYGVTTGFGENFHQSISIDDAKTLQKNIINSHATSLGPRLTEDQTRAVMLMVLLNSGSGYSGVRLETLERYRDFLNLGLYPFAPREGSVGYLSIEAHIARALVGDGKIVENNEEKPALEVLKARDLGPYELSYKEGLSLVSGTTSVTGLGILATYDILKAIKTADIIAALSLEVLRGNLKAYDHRIMEIRRQKYQIETAKNIRNILADSEILKNSPKNLQDALSLRCVPQLHGAAKNTVYDAIKVLENELNAATDNPIIYNEDEVISNGNPDSSYVGLEMDSVAVAATMVGKMCERRTNRLIDGNLSGLPWFLNEKPGLNSGLMIVQYTQAGILNDMKTLAHPAVVDNIPTCGNQEDYVAMGYNASKKALDIAEYLESMLAIELLADIQGYNIIRGHKKASVSEKIFRNLSEKVAYIEDDQFLYDYIVYLKEKIHDGSILKWAEEEIGEIL